MGSPATLRAGLQEILRADALELGFDICRFTGADLPPQTGQHLEESVAQGRHAGMHWLERTMARRKHPQAMWPQARSAVMLGMNYAPDGDPLALLQNRKAGSISVYARNRDYHDLVKGRLKHLARQLAKRTGSEVKVFVDTAPLMEKPLAAKAGLGWQGKHTNLVSRQFGSWLFLGAILTSAELEPDAAETDHCGACRACLDICPTRAFPKPYQLDARRCISYLTIEHQGPLPHEFRKAMGNRIYGCDDCLAVCPWNKFASAAQEAKLKARDDLGAPSLAFLATLDEAEFRRFFTGSPVKRTGRNRFLRNVLIAIGNSGSPALANAARLHLADPDPVVRGAAVWALCQLLQPAETALLLREMADDADESVRNECQIALDGPLQQVMEP